MVIFSCPLYRFRSVVGRIGASGAATGMGAHGEVAACGTWELNSRTDEQMKGVT